MDERVTILTAVCRSQWFSSISTEELKLYLLLLISAVRIGEEEQIAWEVLKRGLGESLTVEKIALLGKALRAGTGLPGCAFPIRQKPVSVIEAMQPLRSTRQSLA